MLAQNKFYSLPLSVQLNIINSYNTSLQQQQFYNLWALYSIANSKRMYVNNTKDMVIDKGNNAQQTLTNATNEPIKDNTNSLYEADLSKGKEQRSSKDRVESSNGNCNSDINDTMPITPIKKQKKNNFFITKKRNRDNKNSTGSKPLTEIIMPQPQQLKTKSKPISMLNISNEMSNKIKYEHPISEKSFACLKKPKEKTIYHVDYKKTKSIEDLMMYNFNYGVEPVKPMHTDEEKENLFARIMPQHDYGVINRKGDDEYKCLFKQVWSSKEINMDDKELKRVLKTFECQWPKKLPYDEELALKIFTMNNYNQEFTAQYIGSESFKNLLTYTTIQNKYLNVARE